MKLLITGTAGFIGYHLATRWIEMGGDVVGLDQINDYYDQQVKYGRLERHGIEKERIQYGALIQSEQYPNYRFIKLDLQDRERIDHLFQSEQFDCVCHLAAQAGVRYSLTNPYAYVESNLVGYLNVLEAAKQQKVGHFVYASSSSVYGANEALPFSTKDCVDHPVSLYAATKKSNELMAHAYSHLYQLPTTGLRFFTVYGPWGRPDMALFLFTKAILAGKPIKVFNHGQMVRDFTYIDDIIEGITRVLQHPPKGDSNWDGKNPDPSGSKAPYKVYNIGNNAPVKLLNFIEAIEKKLNKKAIKKMMPLQAGDVTATYADVDQLVEDFNYQPQTSIESGIEQFIDWYRSFYHV